MKLLEEKDRKLMKLRSFFCRGGEFSKFRCGMFE